MSSSNEQRLELINEAQAVELEELRQAVAELRTIVDELRATRRVLGVQSDEVVGELNATRQLLGLQAVAAALTALNTSPDPERQTIAAELLRAASTLQGNPINVQVSPIVGGGVIS